MFGRCRQGQVWHVGLEVLEEVVAGEAASGDYLGIPEDVWGIGKAPVEFSSDSNLEDPGKRGVYLDTRHRYFDLLQRSHNEATGMMGYLSRRRGAAMFSSS